MIYPKFLNEKGCIGVSALSDGANDEMDINRFKNAIRRFNDMNYKLFVSDNLFNSVKGRSASAKVRAKELDDMFGNNDIDVIICACGGDFLIETLPI